MGRYLILKCMVDGCTKQHRFDGEDVKEIIKEIEKTDWQDIYIPEVTEAMPKGSSTGLCPDHDLDDIEEDE